MSKLKDQISACPRGSPGKIHFGIPRSPGIKIQFSPGKIHYFLANFRGKYGFQIKFYAKYF